MEIKGNNLQNYYGFKMQKSWKLMIHNLKMRLLANSVETVSCAEIMRITVSQLENIVNDWWWALLALGEWGWANGETHKS